MKKTAGSLVFAALLALPSVGCVVRTHGHVRPVAIVEVDEEPPPPRHIVVQPRPGFVYIEGRHVHRHGRYEWVEGRWERQRHGHHWVQGRWERRGRRHAWIEGHWERH
jgi:hypothetical protein